MSEQPRTSGCLNLFISSHAAAAHSVNMRKGRQRPRYRPRAGRPRIALGGQPACRVAVFAWRRGRSSVEVLKIEKMSIKTKREGSEKALPLLLLIFLPKAPGAISPPLPAQRPNYSTPPVSQPHRNLEKKRRGIECANTSRLPPTANPIVNLTLTAQRRRRQRLRHGRCNVCPAQRTEACVCVKAGQTCPATPGTGARPKHEASVKPRVFRLLG
jgi:hypothetical protein